MNMRGLGKYRTAGYMNVSKRAEQVFKEHIPSKKSKITGKKKKKPFSHNLERDLNKNSTIELRVIYNTYNKKQKFKK